MANDSIDEKVNMLEEAGMGIVGLTEKFEDARTQITVLEGEVTRLVRREERRVRRLGHARCLKCGGHVDLGKLARISEEQRYVSARDFCDDELLTDFMLVLKYRQYLWC
jgi:hypothetical protein